MFRVHHPDSVCVRWPPNVFPRVLFTPRPSFFGFLVPHRFCPVPSTPHDFHRFCIHPHRLSSCPVHTTRFSEREHHRYTNLDVFKVRSENTSSFFSEFRLHPRFFDNSEYTTFSRVSHEDIHSFSVCFTPPDFPCVPRTPTTIFWTFRVHSPRFSQYILMISTFSMYTPRFSTCSTNSPTIFP